MNIKTIHHTWREIKITCNFLYITTWPVHSELTDNGFNNKYSRSPTRWLSYMWQRLPPNNIYIHVYTQCKLQHKKLPSNSCILQKMAWSNWSVATQNGDQIFATPWTDRTRCTPFLMSSAACLLMTFHRNPLLH